MAASKTTKKRKGKTATKQQSAGNRFQTEILILVMFAACLILMISRKCHQQHLFWNHGIVCISVSSSFVWGSYVSDCQ